MDWQAAIEKHRTALKRALAGLVAMAGLGQASGRAADAGSSPAAPFLPRRLHRAVLRLLRPAESAARRLVVVAARDLVVVLPPPRRRAKPLPSCLVTEGRGTGIVLPPGASLLLLRGPEDGRDKRLAPKDRRVAPRRMRGVAWSASALVAPCAPAPRPLPPPRLPLFDRPRRIGFDRSRRAPAAVPRIAIPGWSFPVAGRSPPRGEDRVDATRLARRLCAVDRALDDLPGHALRLARWRARQERMRLEWANRDESLAETPRHAAIAEAPPRSRRIMPLRSGPPPGMPRKPRHEMHFILGDAHGLAFWAGERRDTS